MKLTHPDREGSIETDADHADIYLSQGWTKTTTARARDKSGTAPRTTTKKKEEGA